jgi:hypothetical protein
MLSAAPLKPLLLFTGLLLLGSVQPSTAQAKSEPVGTPRVEEATLTRDVRMHLTRSGIPNGSVFQLDPRLIAPATPLLSPLSGEPLIQQRATQDLDPRWRNTLTGAAIGAGISTVAWLGVVCAIYCSGNSDGMGAEIFAIPVITGIGAVVGGLIGYNRPIQPRKADTN